MKRIISRGYICIILLLMYLPIFILAVYSFTTSSQIGSIHGFSTENYKNLFGNGELRGMIIGTLLLAFGRLQFQPY